MRILDKLVDDWRGAYKWASVQLSAFGLSIFGTLAVFPSVALDLWNMLPVQLREIVPAHAANIIAATLFGAVLLGRIFKWKNPAND